MTLEGVRAVGPRTPNTAGSEIPTIGERRHQNAHRCACESVTSPRTRTVVRGTSPRARATLIYSLFVEGVERILTYCIENTYFTARASPVAPVHLRVRGELAIPRRSPV